MNSRKGDVDEVLVALADPTRRRLLDALSAHPKTTATALAEKLPVTRQAIVKHLAVLEQAGLVEARKQGREVQFSVRPERLESTARWMHGVAAAWDERLDKIKRLAEKQEGSER
jgi:DNA-binding transcriptional ArsR family regulator